MSESLLLGIAFGLVLVNACFVAAEFAIVTIRRSRVRALVEGGSRRARVLERILDDLDTHLSAIQLAITSVGLGIGWLGEPTLARMILGVFGNVGLAGAALAHSLAFVVAFAAITATVIICGELAPKFLGLRRTERVALWTAPLVYGLARATAPVLGLMNRAARGILRVLGVSAGKDTLADADPEELRVYLSELSKLGRLSVNRRRMLENVFEFAEHSARQIMIPRDEIDYLSLDRPWEENLAIINDSEHTRYPLCESGLDSVIGMIHIKDLFHRSDTIKGSEDLRKIQHSMLFVPETQPIESLQTMFQRARAHMAIVVDEYGVPTGLVTMEDVLEELVGEIRDEFDIDELPKIERTPDGWLVDGMLLVADLARELGTELETTAADTIGGYVTTTLGRIPQEGDRFRIGTYQGEVLAMQGRRVARVRVQEPVSEEAPVEAAGPEAPAAEGGANDVEARVQGAGRR